MAQESFPKLRWAWRNRRKIGIAALGTTIAIATATNAGKSSTEHPRGNGGTHAEQGDFTNHNPAGALACQLTLVHQGSNASDPYQLRAYVTSGTPPADAKLKYQLKYQGGLSRGFKEFRQDPVVVDWHTMPVVAEQAFAPDGGNALPLASARGDIAGVACGPAIAEQGN